MKLINVSTNQVIAENVYAAYRFWQRFKGLMLTSSMPDHTALHLVPCSSIHTFFMKYRIDILYLNKKNVIVGIEEKLKPGKLGKSFRNVSSVIELPAGKVGSTSVRVGQVVAFVECNKEQVG
jgi:uncharacterized protein